MVQRRLAIRSGAFQSGEALKEWAEPFVRMVKMMMARVKRGTEACLAENAIVERIWEVRAFNLAELGRAFPGTSSTLQTSRNVLKRETYPWCRALASANLGMEGAPLLKEILEDIGQEADLRATALYHLGCILAPDEAEPLMIRFLASVEWPVPSAAIQALAEGAGTVVAVPPCWNRPSMRNAGACGTRPSRPPPASRPAWRGRRRDSLAWLMTGRRDG